MTLGIIEFFTNILVHDHWKSYYTVGRHLTHAECNAHILRYLKAVLDIVKSKDMEELLALLIKMNGDKKKAIENGRESFIKEEIREYESKYEQILASWGEDLNSRISKSENPKIFDDEKNLHDRIVEVETEIILV